MEFELSWVEVDGAGWSWLGGAGWVEVDGVGWRWVHGLVIPKKLLMKVTLMMYLNQSMVLLYRTYKIFYFSTWI